MLSFYWIALVLAVVGALNWGLVGLLDFDLVAALFGPMSSMTRLVYSLVGLAGLILAFTAGNVPGRMVSQPSTTRLGSSSDNVAYK